MSMRRLSVTMSVVSLALVPVECVYDNLRSVEFLLMRERS
jgi:hypothetical protein